MRRNLSIIAAGVISILGVIIILLFWHYKSTNNLPSTNTSTSSPPTQANNVEILPNQYPLHKNIIATTFWIGESASGSNAFISNVASAWDDNWQVHYGGVDDPKNRDGFYPADFTPQENPFYFALPYNDFDANGNRKTDVNKIIYWANDFSWDASQSMLKNQWIKITHNGISAYAQWEDVGPFGEDDSSYVFGAKLPQSQSNNNAGLDLSPAIQTFLNLSGEGSVDWQFVKEADVPAGPWKDIITTS